MLSCVVMGGQGLYQGPVSQRSGTYERFKRDLTNAQADCSNDPAKGETGAAAFSILVPNGEDNLVSDSTNSGHTRP